MNEPPFFLENYSILIRFGTISIPHYLVFDFFSCQLAADIYAMSRKVLLPWICGHSKLLLILPLTKWGVQSLLVWWNFVNCSGLFSGIRWSSYFSWFQLFFSSFKNSCKFFPRETVDFYYKTVLERIRWYFWSTFLPKKGCKLNVSLHSQV